MDCNLCPTLFELAHAKPNTWVRIGLFHGRRDGLRDDACHVEIIRDDETITGIGVTWQEAMEDLQTKLRREKA